MARGSHSNLPMRFHGLTLVVWITGLLLPATAIARPSARFLLDGSLAVDIPFADAAQRDQFLPSPTVGLSLGAEIWLTPRLGLAPEFQIDGGPLIPRHSSALSTGHARLVPGLRLLFGIGHGHALFLRWLLGLDTLIYGPGGAQGSGTFDLGVAIESGVGMQFRVARRTVLGFLVAVPVGIHDVFDTRPVAAAVDLRFFVGLR
jgi:hypothetical protein